MTINTEKFIEYYVETHNTKAVRRNATEVSIVVLPSDETILTISESGVVKTEKAQFPHQVLLEVSVALADAKITGA